MTTILIILAALAWLACGYAAMALFWGDQFVLVPDQDTGWGDIVMSFLGVVLAPVAMITMPLIHIYYGHPNHWTSQWDWPVKIWRARR